MNIPNIFLAVPLALSLSAFGSGAVAQSGDIAQQQPGKVPPSLPVLYRSFLAYQLHLEKRADELKVQGRNGEDFRAHYQKVLGFSDQEFVKVHQSAVHLDTALQAKDAEIHDLIVAARAARPPGPLAPGTGIPPPPQRLKVLFDERLALINAEIDTLHKELAPEDAKKLDDFLQKQFTSSVTVGTIPPPTPKPWLLPKGATQ